MTGEVGIPSNAQNTSNLAGQGAPREPPAAGAAPGNPFGNRVFSFGHRNMFGIAIDPQTGQLWVSENGPGCNDEINPLVNGGNFAWGPSQSCGVPAGRRGHEPRRPRSPGSSRRASTTRPSPRPGRRSARAAAWARPPRERCCSGAWNDGGIRRVTLNAGRGPSVTASAADLRPPAGRPGAWSGHRTGAIYFSDPDQIFVLNP